LGNFSRDLKIQVRAALWKFVINIEKKMASSQGEERQEMVKDQKLTVFLEICMG